MRHMSHRISQLSTFAPQAKGACSTKFGAFKEFRRHGCAPWRLAPRRACDNNELGLVNFRLIIQFAPYIIVLYVYFTEKSTWLTNGLGVQCTTFSF